MINLDTNRYYSLPTSPTQHTCASVWVSVHASERASERAREREREREREMGGRRGGGDEGVWGRGGGGGGCGGGVGVGGGGRVFLNLLTAKSKGKPYRFTDYSAR